MFEHITDLSFERNRKQAIGFYLTALLAGGILTALVVYIYMRATGMHIPKGGDFADALSMVRELKRITVPVVFLISMSLTVAVIKAKNIRCSGAVKKYTFSFVGAFLFTCILFYSLYLKFWIFAFPIYCAFYLLFLSIAIWATLKAKAKKAYDLTALGCALLTILLSATGAFFSFMPIAYLTTLPKGN